MDVVFLGLKELCCFTQVTAIVKSFVNPHPSILFPKTGDGSGFARAGRAAPWDFTEANAP